MARQIKFEVHPNLLSVQLGKDLYAPAAALVQLVTNSLDAGCTNVDLQIESNGLDTPVRLILRDDGLGIAPDEMEAAFGLVGAHVERSASAREVVGSRGIGRFAVFSLSVESRWKTVAKRNDQKIRQSWVMVPGRKTVRIEETEAETGTSTGTEIDMTLRTDDAVVRLFSSEKTVRRELFNGLASYIARYQGEVHLMVNGEEVTLNDFADETVTEEIPPVGGTPGGKLHHLVLGTHVDQSSSNLLLFATHGATICSEELLEQPIPNKKYLGLVDSPYFAELTNTSKSDLARLDPGFLALREEVVTRAKSFIGQRQDARSKSFLDYARKQAFYPYRAEALSLMDTYSRTLYDSVLLTLEEQYRISNTSHAQQKLIFLLTKQLLQSEDLATVLTSVLGLTGNEVERFAALLRRTSLSSVIAVADLVAGRLQFLEELQELIYGDLGERLKERSQLHKIVEGHTWLFGEQYYLMGSDQSLSRLLKKFAIDVDSEVGDSSDLNLIPDLYLAQTKGNDEAKYYQHLVVEMKRPSVRVGMEHVAKLRKYASAIVGNSVWGQRINSHRFTFVLVSADISEEVRESYTRGRDPGLLAEPSLVHPTELWALKWSDFIERSRYELSFVQKKMEITADPELMEYLRDRVGEYLPGHHDDPK